jgi:hypothetical protein
MRLETLRWTALFGRGRHTLSAIALRPPARGRFPAHVDQRRLPDPKQFAPRFHGFIRIGTSEIAVINAPKIERLLR